MEWDDIPDVIVPVEEQCCLQTHFTVNEYQEDVLVFWRDHHYTDPLLSMLARAVLCIPATSASSAFSSAGRVLKACRNRLNL